MTTLDIAHRRLFSQRLLGAKLETPNDVVSWLGAVQAQDYAGDIRWVLSLTAPRVQAATRARIASSRAAARPPFTISRSGPG